MPDTMQQLAVGGLAIVIGVSGWLLPFEWNVLRLRRRYAELVSDDVNRALPKVVGTVLVLAGAGLVLHAAGIV